MLIHLLLNILMSINESDIFEENNLYILGNTLKNTIELIREEFESIYKEIITTDISMNNDEKQDDLELDLDLE
jgi:hypothetical protein